MGYQTETTNNEGPGTNKNRRLLTLARPVSFDTTSTPEEATQVPA